MPSSMATKLVDVTPEQFDQVVKTINNQYYQILDLESVVRKLETRIDNFVPTSMHLRVMPVSNIVWSAALVGAAVCGYLAYTEVRRSSKQND